MTLSVLTWNLCGLDPRRLDERTEAACFHVLSGAAGPPPDVVMLQEVVRRSLMAHLRPHFAAAGYTLAPSEPVSDSHYFCAIAVGPALRPLSAWRRPFPGSFMGRALLGLVAEWGDDELLVCTSHLESLRDGAAARRRQVTAVAEALAAHEGPAVFGGDTNLRGAVDDLLEPHGVHDAWQAVGRPAPVATWWPIDAKGPRGRPMRFDRLWLSGGLKASEVQVGRPLPVADLRASDHRYVRTQCTR